MKFLFCLYFIVFLSIQAQDNKTNLDSATKEYYLQFIIFSELASGEYSLELAYDFFVEKIQPIGLFFQKFGIKNLTEKEIEEIRISHKQKAMYCFFYPLWLYEKRELLYDALDKKKQKDLANQIAKKEAELSTVIDQKIQLEDKQKIMRKDYENLEAEYSEWDSKIRQGEKKLANCKIEKEKYALLIVEKKSKWSFCQAKVEEMRIRIANLYRLWIAEKDPVKKEKLHRQLRLAESEKNDYTNRISHLEGDIRDAQENLRTIENQLATLPSSIQEWKLAISSVKERMENANKEIEKTKKLMDNVDATIKPLQDLFREKQKRDAILKEFSAWWQKANKKPRRNFLQALYVLKNFPKEYYSVKIKKSYALEGIAAVYFW